MDKKYTEQDFQESSATERNLDVTVADTLHVSCNVTEVQQECNKDATLELPATKSATAKHFDISRTGLDRWITALENKGYQIIDNKKVSESGFGLLSDLNSARTKGLKPSEFVEGLPTTQTQEQAASEPVQSELTVYGSSKAENPYAIEVKPLATLPELVIGEPVEIDFSVLQENDVTDQLAELVTIAQAQTVQEIERANELKAKAVAANEMVNQLAQLKAQKEAAVGSANQYQQTIDNLAALLGK